MKLRENADTTHEDPEHWYAAYGAHISTESAGDVCIQEVDPDWLIESEDDQDLIAAHPSLRALPGYTGTLTDDEFAELVARARAVWDEACALWDCRERAVDAYRHGDLALVVDRLEITHREERKHGDDPATRALRAQLLEETA